MSDTDTSTETVEEFAGDAEPSDANDGRGYASRALRAVGSGRGLSAVAGIGSVVTFLDGVRALRRGDGERGVGRIALGGVLVATAVELRRSAGERADVDQTDVVSTAPDLGDLETGASGRDRHASGADAQRVVDSSVDLEDVVPERESYERLGGAAFDEHSGRIPVPQETVNRNVLSLNSEAYWGIRAGDDAVVVSGRFDPIQDREGIRYVASTEIDGDRLLTIPDTVLNHWDSVAGGGTAVASGDEIAFVTADSLEADGQIRLVPEQWLEDE